MITASPPVHYGETALGDAYGLLLARDSDPTVKAPGVGCVLLEVGGDRTQPAAELRLLPEEARRLAALLLEWARWAE